MLRESTVLAGGRGFVVLIALSASSTGCDALIGLGDEPVASGGGATPTASSAASSGDVTASTTTVSASSGDGGGGASSSSSGSSGSGESSSASTGTGGGGGEAPAPPCGACDTNAECGNGGRCDTMAHACLERVVSFESLPLDGVSNRGFGVADDRAAIISTISSDGGGGGPPAISSRLAVVSLIDDLAPAYIALPGGGIVSSSPETIVYASYGNDVVSSELRRLECGEHDPASCDAVPPAGQNWLGTFGYGAMGWAGDIAPDMFVAARNVGHALEFVSFADDAEEPCALTASNADCLAPFEISPAPGRVAYTETGCPDPAAIHSAEVVEVCDTAVLSTDFTPGYKFTIGVAGHGIYTAFTACNDDLVNCSAFVYSEAQFSQVQDADGGMPVPPSSAIGFREDGSMLVPGRQAGVAVLMECRSASDDENYVCETYQKRPNVPFDGLVYELVAEEERTVAVVTDGAASHQIICIDEALRAEALSRR